MGKAAQAGLDPTKDDRHPGEEGMGQVGIDNGRPVRPEQSAARRVNIMAATL